MIIAENVLVDFVHPNSYLTVLGFDTLVYGKGRHVRQHMLNMMGVQSILFTQM